MIVSGQFSFGKVSISVENEAFGNRLQRVYELDRESERDAPDYFIRIDDSTKGLHPAIASPLHQKVFESAPPGQRSPARSTIFSMRRFEPASHPAS